MKTKINGLQMQLSKARADLGRMTARADDAELSPQDQHTAKNAVPRLRDDVSDLEQAIAENTALIEDIEAMIQSLRDSKHPSARRTIALRKLEEASDSLRRELGDHPTD